MNERSMDCELPAKLAAIVVGAAPLSDGSAAAQSRVGPVTIHDLGSGQEEWAVTPAADRAVRLAALRTLAHAAATRSFDTLTWQFSGVTLDRAALIEALAGWTPMQLPVHALIAFDFSVADDRRPIAGIVSHGLAAIVGQEIHGYPRIEAQRREAARVVVRLAHELLTTGPIRQTRWIEQPGVPDQQVRLVPSRSGDRLDVIF